MTIENKAKGCLLGLACGDAVGRPVEFKSAEEIASQHGSVTGMLGYGTHGLAPGTITDDTEMALCIAESLVYRRGFDPADVAERFVHWFDTDPIYIGWMTRDSLSRIRQGKPWDEAGVEVWESRPEGSNAGNGSVMRCAPYAIAFRDFEEELTHVSRLSSGITHADPRCRWGCAILNQTLANLICDETDPLGNALKSSYSAPDELRTALLDVHKVVTGERERSQIEAQLSTSGSVVDTLQAALYYGLTADSVKIAVVNAVNRGGDTDTIGAIAGAVAGARFGSDNIPDKWTNEIEKSRRLEELAQQLLTIRMEIPGKEYETVADGSIIFKQRTIEGPAYIPVREFQETTIGHRPQPAPHRTIGTIYHDLTPSTAAMLDWERRAYAVKSGRCTAYTGPQPDSDDESELSQSLVPVPQYPFVISFDDLPEYDQQRIMRDGRAAADAFVRAYAAFAGIRHPITEMETETIGIERADPIAGATRALVVTFDDVGRALLRNNERGGYESPEEIKIRFDTSVIEDLIAGYPCVFNQIVGTFSHLLSEAAAILDYVTQLRFPQHQETLTNPTPEDQLATIRDSAHTMVGELYVMHESLRRVAVRHPGVNFERWQAMATKSGDQ
ncbi:ADP-ribosylglycohydrolase family protein [Natrialbaceae archaeon A-CW2]